MLPGSLDFPRTPALRVEALSVPETAATPDKIDIEVCSHDLWIRFTLSNENRRVDGKGIEVYSQDPSVPLVLSNET